MKEITDKNLKEPSTIYDLKEKGIERVELSISDKMKFQIKTTKYVIKKEQIETLPMPIPRKEELEEER